MLQIRRSVFETNSSSTHSLTMCLKSEYDRWVAGEVFLDESAGRFLTKDEAYAELRKFGRELETMDNEDAEEMLRDYGIYTAENYNDEYLEGFEEEFTTPGGEHVMAFGKYGFDY